MIPFFSGAADSSNPDWSSDELQDHDDGTEDAPEPMLPQKQRADESLNSENDSHNVERDAGCTLTWRTWNCQGISS